MKSISLAEPVTDLRRIPIRECGEPMVDFLSISPRVRLSRARWNYTRATHVRSTVAEMLVRAGDALPHGLVLAVVEGWRPPYIQKRLYASSWQRWKERRPEWSDIQLRRVVNRYTAPLHGRVPPPHSTGGAVDVLLMREDGSELEHLAPYEIGDHSAYPMLVSGLTAEAQQSRDILTAALEAGGLTNYPSEWWHWSYGDQGWAYRTGNEYAVYGPVEPEGWVGNPFDMADEPLMRSTAT